MAPETTSVVSSRPGWKTFIMSIVVNTGTASKMTMQNYHEYRSERNQTSRRRRTEKGLCLNDFPIPAIGEFDHTVDTSARLSVSGRTYSAVK